MMMLMMSYHCGACTQGWFVQFIDREYMKRKAELDKKKKADLDEDLRQQRLIAQQAEVARARLEESGK
jgi:hypothetical protein